jgi:hypothetical protein
MQAVFSIWFLHTLHCCVLRSTKATKSVGVKDTARDRRMLTNCATGVHLEDGHVSQKKKRLTHRPTAIPQVRLPRLSGSGPQTKPRRRAIPPSPIPTSYPDTAVRTPDVRQPTPQSGPSVRNSQKMSK